jgi:hypothetical protein
MMTDEKIAKSFLSAIIEEEVVELDSPTIYKHSMLDVDEAKVEDYLFFTACRFDFPAKIALQGGGFKSVIIELQKAKLSSDIRRFRRFLELKYNVKNPDNTSVVDDENKSRQIYYIFLFGYNIGYPGYPVLQVDHGVKDVSTKRYLSDGKDNEFVQTLHHPSWIVQMDQLRHRRRNYTERLLSIFDQDNCTQNHFIMSVSEGDFPDIYRPIIYRLHMASEDEQINRKQIKEETEMEYDYWKDTLDRQWLIVNKNRAIEEKDRAIEEKDKMIEEKDKEIEELKKRLETLKAI